nr:Rossmann-like and DUF2520 domain-containing protein [Acinetobacter sp. Marseille-Q1620]
MRISFIGSGRVATKLAQALYGKHQIIQIISPNINNAKKLADLVHADAADDFSDIQSDVDLVVIAVSDQAISDVIQKLHLVLPETCIVHTSGSTGLEVLTKQHARSGVFYPLQTFSFERVTEWENTPLFVEAAERDDLNLLTELAKELSQRVYQYDSVQRLSLHLAAVFACNFSNYCYDMAKQIVDAKQVDFSLLYPLILETANKATQNDPRLMQTGPAMRGDLNILQMHKAMLLADRREDLAEIYQLMSDGIENRQY